MPAQRNVVKLLGTPAWSLVSDAVGGKITRAIMRGKNEIVIDAECEGYRFSINLKRRSGDFFQGAWSRPGLATTYGGSASGTLYASNDGHFLFGKWHEDGDDYYWWVELSVVEHFLDEASV
jgi:hypothetical protein